mgnify:CR=1 FL=1
MSFAETLKTLRKERKTTKREICEKTGIAVRSYQSYESEERTPSIDVLNKIADYYNVTTDFLLGRSEHIQIIAENGLTDSDEEFLKQNQEQLVKLLKDKQSELDQKEARIKELEIQVADLQTRLNEKNVL